MVLNKLNHSNLETFFNEIKNAKTYIDIAP